jgi:hypothetical protein
LLETPTKQETVEILAETISISCSLHHKEGVFPPTQQPRRLTKSFADPTNRADETGSKRKENRDRKEKEAKVFCMSLSTYDNLTKTANIFFGGRSTFFDSDYYSFTRVLRELFVIDQDNEKENMEPLAVPRRPSSPQIPELRTSTASKLSDFSQFRETSFFGEYSPSLNSASLFFLFIHYEEENQAAFFIGEISRLDEMFFYRHISKLTRKIARFLYVSCSSR